MTSRAREEGSFIGVTTAVRHECVSGHACRPQSTQRMEQRFIREWLIDHVTREDEPGVRSRERSRHRRLLHHRRLHRRLRRCRLRRCLLRHLKRCPPRRILASPLKCRHRRPPAAQRCVRRRIELEQRQGAFQVGEQHACTEGGGSKAGHSDPRAELEDPKRSISRRDLEARGGDARHDAERRLEQIAFAEPCRELRARIPQPPGNVARRLCEYEWRRISRRDLELREYKWIPIRRAR